MKLREFAERYMLRVNDRKHESKYGLETGEDTIHGRYGEIVDDPSYGLFAVKFITVPRNAVKTAVLRGRYRQAMAGGLMLKRRQGDAESTFFFDPANEWQSELTIRLVGAKRRRAVNLTAEQRAAIGERLRTARTPSVMPVAA